MELMAEFCDSRAALVDILKRGTPGMKISTKTLLFSLAASVLLCSPVFATVQITSMTANRKSPQVIGTSITWTVTATNSNSGLLTFQFNVARPGGPFVMVKDFNVGSPNAGTWTSQPFVWTPTGVEGVYQIQAVIKDFKSGETASKTVSYQVTPLVTGSTPVVVPTANALVALFSAPSCAAGSSMRVVFQEQSKATPPSTTTWAACHPPATMTFQIAGMYPETSYTMFSQTATGSSMVNGPPLTFTTRALPTRFPFPNFQVLVPPGPETDSADPVLLYNMVQLGGGTHFPDVATDLSGRIIWYYYSGTQFDLVSRPLQNGGFLGIQSGPAWNPASQQGQMLRQIDLGGNIIRETNTGAIQQQLLLKGAVNANPCNALPKPAPVGAGCLSAFHHDAIQTLPNGFTAVIASVEKIFPPGTHGDTSGLPVDVIGDMIVVLNANWQVVWYFDVFDHDGGAPELDINRPAVLGNTCVSGQTGCPPVFLLGTGIAPKATDWLHANTLYYSSRDGSLLFCLRNQDWVVKIDYGYGSGTGNILWRMGPDGDFTFNNIYNDPWPWFSGPHDSAMESAGLMTIFDNGNTRVSPPPLGLGSGYSRGMALSVNEAQRSVTPVLSADLGVYSSAMGSAQLLSNGNYFFYPGIVLVTLNIIRAYSIEILPVPGTGTGTQVLNVQGPEGYRAWQMRSMYSPPAT
jgi:hypothetical protein